MAGIADVFTESERTNWLKAWLAIDIAKSGLEKFVETEATTLHGNIYNAILSSGAVACVDCHTANLLKCPSRGICNKRGAQSQCTSMHDSPLKQPRPCSANVCNRVRDEIENQHKFSNPSWKNTSANHWSSSPWHIAKAYFPPDGYTETSSVQDTDFNGIISFMMNCKHFNNTFSFPIAPGKPHPPCLLTKAREFCRTVRHSSTFKVTDTDLHDIFITLISLLTDTQCLAHDVDAREAVRKLAKLQTNVLKLTTEEIINYENFCKDIGRGAKVEWFNFDGESIWNKIEQDQKLCDAEEEELVLNMNTVTLVTRTQWHALSSKEDAQYMTMPVSHVFIHHTVMSECVSQREGAIEMRKIQHLHQDINRWADIGYNFVIGQDGSVYMGRGWDRVGAHTLGWNNKSISFAFTGNFTEKQPTDDALKALDAALVLGVKLGKLTPDFKLHGHRDARPTESPGQKLYDLIRKHEHYEPIGPNIVTFSPKSRV
ncbi:uncharacterized protein LOC127862599 isoform X1 [Dreissena polymorpha]|uniref:Uncharacterized protein n=1 Tax=Dreissena polymorpha TaxID=45954 RepID=A0A9D4BI65_DREPO|nr:uncharacterized protein LOC127862599 isoform X1 [Dreissena polymorpha]KAH3694403.1 hypothetical protein DPMN_081843 [Dreissena polymorpha]